MFTGCTGGWSFGGAQTYNCEWRDSMFLQFDNVNLGLPCSEGCAHPFESNELSYYFPIYSFYDAMWKVRHLIPLGLTCNLKWSASVFNKVCDQTTISKSVDSITVNQDDFENRLSVQDVIEEIPIVKAGNGILDTDYKFNLTFQIKGVTNWHQDHSGEIGSLTWTKTYTCDYTNLSIAAPQILARFTLTSEEVPATFVPDRGHGRYIYMHDHFEYN